MRATMARQGAGEGLPDATRQLWKDATGIEMTDGIGATEMFHIFISSAGEDVRRGAIGKVTRVEEAEVNVEIAPSVNIRVVKAMIAEVRNRTAVAANDSKA